MARDMIVAWNAYRPPPLPKGLLWNDHATAARIRVLGEFWRLDIGGVPTHRPEVGRAVLEQAARYGALLAKRGRFTFASNHGMMQNLALLQLERAFRRWPAVISTASWPSSASVSSSRS